MIGEVINQISSLRLLIKIGRRSAGWFVESRRFSTRVGCLRHERKVLCLHSHKGSDIVFFKALFLPQSIIFTGNVFFRGSLKLILSIF